MTAPVSSPGVSPPPCCQREGRRDGRPPCLYRRAGRGSPRILRGRLRSSIELTLAPPLELSFGEGRFSTRLRASNAEGKPAVDGGADQHRCREGEAGDR